MTDDLRARLKTLANDVRDATHGEMFIRLPGMDAMPMAKFLDDLLATFDTPEAGSDLAEQMRHRQLGVYRLFWKSGGFSVASVGMTYDGTRWYAPANWTTGSADASLATVVSTDWGRVDRVELIEVNRSVGESDDD